MAKKKKGSKTSKDDKENEDVEETEDEEEEEESAEDDSDEDSEDEDDSEADDEDESDEDESDEIDFGSELEKEKKRGKPDPKKAAEAFKERNKKRKGEVEEDDEEEDDEDKPMTRREMREFLAGQSKVQNAGEIRRIAYGLADSDDEAEYIIELHKNRIFPDDLSIADQVEEAHAIANRKRSKAKMKELLRAKKGKKGVSKGGGTSGHQESFRGPAPKVPDDLKASLKRSGFVLDTKDRKWKKKLPNGKTLVKDTPTGRPRLV